MCDGTGLASLTHYSLSTRFEVMLKAGLIWLEVFSPELSCRQRMVMLVGDAESCSGDAVSRGIHKLSTTIGIHDSQRSEKASPYQHKWPSHSATLLICLPEVYSNVSCGGVPSVLQSTSLSGGLLPSKISRVLAAGNLWSIRPVTPDRNELSSR